MTEEMMKPKCVRSSGTISRFAIRGVPLAGAGLLLVTLAVGTAHAQTLLSETTWGGTGSDVSNGVATADDGTSYMVGITDSFTTDQFGSPSPRIFLVKFAPNGSLVWQKIWNGTTVIGLGRAGVALGTGGSVYVTGLSSNNGNDAVLLKFDANGTLLWERTWGGPDSDESLAVAAAPDGSAYIVGTATSFGPSSSGLFVVKFDASGNLVWQRISDGAAGNAVAVGPDGSVYAAGTTPRPGVIGNFDVLVLKITADGTLVWERTYSSGEVVDPRGGMTVGSDGSAYIVGAIQTAKANFVDIAALIVKLSAAGDLLFDKEFAGKFGETATGVAVAPDDGTIYVAGTTTTFGAGSQDAFVLHLLPTGKKLLDAVTWGGTGFEEGSGVGVIAGTVVLAATTTNPPPYSLLNASARLSAARGTVAVVAGSLADPAGTPADPGAGVATATGSTIFGGNFEAALVRIAR
jgi:predicted Rdx family selenoprotein